MVSLGSLAVSDNNKGPNEIIRISDVHDAFMFIVTIIH